eukprot:2302581-Prymnesium_polylepis.2
MTPGVSARRVPAPPPASRTHTSPADTCSGRAYSLPKAGSICAVRARAPRACSCGAFAVPQTSTRLTDHDSTHRFRLDSQITTRLTDFDSTHRFRLDSQISTHRFRLT